MKLLDRLYFTASFYGNGQLPAKGPFILACNHISNLDPFIVGICTRRRFGFVAKEELFKGAFQNFIFRQMGAFPIRRDTSDFRAIRETFKRLDAGGPIILFPEGTRGVGNRAKENQPGVGLIAHKSRLPVFPVFIEGSDQAYPEGAKWFKRHPVNIYIGKPLTFTEKKPYAEIANDIMQAVYSLAPQSA